MCFKNGGGLEQKIINNETMLFLVLRIIFYKSVST